MIYSYAGGSGAALNGQERPPLTAAAVACSFSAGQYKGDLAKKWIKFCKDNIPIAKGRVGHDEYQSYYFSQVVYVLGDDRYGELFPKEAKNTWLTWSKYKEAMFPYLIDSQDKNTRRVDRRLHRPRVRHVRQPDHPATGEGHPADLPALNQRPCRQAGL